MSLDKEIKEFYAIAVPPATAWNAFLGQNVARPFPAATTVSVSSSNANDAAAGTGVRTVRVTGLNASYEEITEDLSMNGQTEVTGSKVFARVNNLEALTWGTGLVAAGDIYAYGSTDNPASGVPAAPATYLFAKILAGFSNSAPGFMAVPRGKRLLLDYFNVAVYDSASRYGRCRLLKRAIGGGWTIYPLPLCFATAATTGWEFKPKYPIIVNEMEEFQLEVYVSAAGPTYQAYIAGRYTNV